MVDNYRTKGLFPRASGIKLRLDGGINSPTDRRKYRLDVRPDLWWNAVDGIEAGVHFEGNYLQSIYHLDGSIWWNTHLLQQSAYMPVEGTGTYDHYDPMNYTLNYTTSINRNMPKLKVQLNSRYLDGLWYHRGGFSWTANDNNIVQLYAKTMWRPAGPDLDYLTDPGDWSSIAAKPNSSINAAWTHSYNYFNGYGMYTFSFRVPAFTNAFNYSYAQLESVNDNSLGKLDIKTRFLARYGVGDRLPSESLLYMAGAQP
jgi:aminopeptidase N